MAAICGGALPRKTILRTAFMVSVRRRAVTARAFVRTLFLVSVVSSCGGGATVGPDKNLDFLVGDWGPTRIVVQRKANSGVTRELIPGGLVRLYLAGIAPIYLKKERCFT